MMRKGNAKNINNMGTKNILEVKKYNWEEKDR